jgi:glycosyltransferase involved in cell wall biosynthesis
VRLLFVKRALAWPRSSGHDVFTYHTMKACSELGHTVFLAVASDTDRCALGGLRLEGEFRFDGTDSVDGAAGGTWLQRRFRSFFGVPESYLQVLARIEGDIQPDAVIGSGLDVLPYFAAFSRTKRVWWAADELAWHHLSQMRVGASDVVANLRDAAIKMLYERAHRRLVDRVWVVTDTERRAMRWLAGMPRADVLSLGVDGSYFAPGDEPVAERTAAFWGRLDFGPNIQALEWFCRSVWPLVRQAAPGARFTIIGFRPTERVHRLGDTPGVTIMANVPYLRALVRRHALVALPFISGGGMKNKLLEAASLGMPIVCTPAATSGLGAVADLPLAVESKGPAMAHRIVELWSNAERRRHLGAAAREWVLTHHTWTAMGRKAVAALERTVNS